MIRKFTHLIMSVFCLLPLGSLAQIAAWNFNGQSNITSFAATTWVTGLDNSSSLNLITRGPGAVASTGNNSFRTTGFQNDGIAISNSDYFQITLKAIAGYELSLSSIDATFGGTTSFYATPGVTHQFAYSLDGTNFTLIASPIQTTSLTLPQVAVGSVTALQNVPSSTTVYLRYYASGQTTTGGWGFTSPNTATNGLAIGGTLTPVSTCTAPSTQASSIATSGVTTNSFSANWTRGNGNNILAVARLASTPANMPTSGTAYTADATFGNNAAGYSTGTGNYVVYNGTGTNVTINGLSSGVTYAIDLYEYNTTGICYLLPGATQTETTNLAYLSYTWNGNTSTDWSVASNWTPARNVASAGDILLFNNGLANSVTNVTPQNIAQLILSNNTTVNLQAGAAGTLNINGATGVDFSVGNGSAMSVTGSNALVVNLATGATALIEDEIEFTAAAHKLTAADASAIYFDNGSSFTQGSGVTGNVFGTTVANSVIFADGSSFNQEAGSNPFGMSSPASVVVFQPSSSFILWNTLTPSFTGRVYGNFYYYGSGTISPTAANVLEIGSITIGNGIANLSLTGANAHVIKGNISVSSGATLNFNPSSSGIISFNGTTAQSITNNGTLTFSPTQQVRINNPAGVELMSPIIVEGTLDLLAGNITSTTSNMLTLGAAAVVTGGSNLSFVNGPVTTLATASINIILPVGKAGKYRPIELLPAGTGAFPTQYVAEYFSTAPANRSSLQTGLAQISSVEYWDIAQPNGTVSTDVKLNWGATSGVLVPNNVVVAHYNGSAWQGLVSVPNPSSTTTFGSVTTFGVTSFSPFTLGGTTNTTLPIHLASIEVINKGKINEVKWVSKNEDDALGYTLQRSANGREFIDIAALNANGKASEYFYTDLQPINGKNYYRLLLKNINGLHEYSKVVWTVNTTDQGVLQVAPNPAQDKIVVRINDFISQKASISIMDVTGKTLRSYPVVESLFSISLEGIATGLYYLVLQNGQQKQMVKLQVK